MKHDTDHCIGVTEDGHMVYLSENPQERPYQTFVYCPNCGDIICDIVHHLMETVWQLDHSVGHPAKGGLDKNTTRKPPKTQYLTKETSGHDEY